MKRRRDVFLDTGILLALVLPGDPDHAAALRLLESSENWRSLWTSDYVVAEGLDFLRQKVKRRKPAEDFIGLAFGAEGKAHVDDVLRVHSGRFAAALERYRNEFDRGLSFTDWTSVILIEEKKLDAIATLDGGFRGLVDVVDGAN